MNLFLENTVVTVHRAPYGRPDGPWPTPNFGWVGHNKWPIGLYFTLLARTNINNTDGKYGLSLLLSRHHCWFVSAFLLTVSLSVAVLTSHNA